MKKQIALFVSGTGSNARVMIDRLAGDPSVAVALVVSNKPDAPALLMAAERSIPTLVLDKRTFFETEQLLDVLAEWAIDFIVLAGFLWLIPAYLVRAFPKRMVNIHPALLPKYGGKGMYGHHVHEAVKAAGEIESGITIHYVNEAYDEGGILFQAKVAIATTDDAAAIAAKVLVLEHQYYTAVVKDLLGALPPNK